MPPQNDDGYLDVTGETSPSPPPAGDTGRTAFVNPAYAAGGAAGRYESDWTAAEGAHPSARAQPKGRSGAVKIVVAVAAVCLVGVVAYAVYSSAGGGVNGSSGGSSSSGSSNSVGSSTADSPTAAPVTPAPSSVPQTAAPNQPPTTEAPVTLSPTTVAPTTPAPTTLPPTVVTAPPVTDAPVTAAPATVSPTTLAPTTLAPTTREPTGRPTYFPTTARPSDAPTVRPPPTTRAPTAQCTGRDQNSCSQPACVYDSTQSQCIANCGAGVAQSREECVSPCQWIGGFTGQYTCFPPGVAIGRPFVVNGVQRMAETDAVGCGATGTGTTSSTTNDNGPDGGWADDDTDGLGSAAAAASLPNSTAARSALTRFWSTTGAAEHASVASFARHSLQLMALGAPRRLVQGAHEAAMDEVRHARVAFALASAYGGDVVGPGPLDVSGSLEVAAGRSLEDEVVALTVVEGCVGETVAALEARASAALCEDSAVAGVFERVASDEARHARLAWDVVLWHVARHPRRAAEVKRMVLEAASARAARAGGVGVAGADEATASELRHFGVLSAEDAARVSAAALTHVLEPMAASVGAAADGGSVVGLIAGAGLGVDARAGASVAAECLASASTAL